MNAFKRTLAGLVMAATAIMSALPAQAAPVRAAPVLSSGDGIVTNVGDRRYYRDRRYRDRRHHRGNNGAAIAGALIGGAIIGGVIANSRRDRVYQDRYYAPRRVYQPRVRHYRAAPRYVAPRRVYRSGLSDRHIQYCYNRYRSYRASDNTFQPYGHRPRQQCR